jgi:hypothetical protein
MRGLIPDKLRLAVWYLSFGLEQIFEVWNVLEEVEQSHSDSSKDSDEADAQTCYAAFTETTATALNANCAVLRWQIRSSTDSDDGVLWCAVGFDLDIDFA